uniref:Uncharacterized protein n=1 Tax=Cannabis sativa TaxID=3483 RepID=A0A803QWM2_CANSA
MLEKMWYFSKSVKKMYNFKREKKNLGPWAGWALGTGLARLCPGPGLMPNICNLKGYDIFSHIAATHNDTELEKIVCIMWCIWCERNKESHGSKLKIANVICSFSATYLIQYQKAIQAAAPHQNSDAQTCSTQVAP